MQSYENLIYEKLLGDTPRQKYDYLLELMSVFQEHKSGIESVLLSECDKLEKIGKEMYNQCGSDSYVERCNIHDAQMKIYALTNKWRIEKMTFIEWREEIQSKK